MIHGMVYSTAYNAVQIVVLGGGIKASYMLCNISIRVDVLPIVLPACSRFVAFAQARCKVSHRWYGLSYGIWSCVFVWYVLWSAVYGVARGMVYGMVYGVVSGMARGMVDEAVHGMVYNVVYGMECNIGYGKVWYTLVDGIVYGMVYGMVDAMVYVMSYNVVQCVVYGMA